MIRASDVSLHVLRTSPARVSAPQVDLAPLTRPLPSAAALNATKLGAVAFADSMSSSPQTGRSSFQMASDGSARSPRISAPPFFTAPAAVATASAAADASLAVAVSAASPGGVSVPARSPVRGQLHLSSRALSGALSLLNSRASIGSASSPAASPSHSHSSASVSHPSASPVSPASGERVVVVSGSSHSRSPRGSVSVSASVSAACASSYLFAAAAHAPATAASLLRASGSQSPLRGSLQASGRSHRSPSLGPSLSPMHASASASARGDMPSLSPLPPSQSPQPWPSAGLQGASHIASFEAAFRGGRSASLSISAPAAAAPTPLDQAAADSSAAISAALAAGEWSPGARALSRAAHSRGTAAVADSVRELLRADSRAGRTLRPPLTTTMAMMMRPAQAADAAAGRSGSGGSGGHDIGSNFDDPSPAAAAAVDDEAPYSPAAAAIAEDADDATSATAGDAADNDSPREAGAVEAESRAVAAIEDELEDHHLAAVAGNAASNDDAGGWA